MPNDDLSRLLPRFLARETTPEEDAIVRAWLDESTQNRERFRAFKEAWAAVDTRQLLRIPPESWDLQLGWAALARRLEEEEGASVRAEANAQAQANASEAGKVIPLHTSIEHGRKHAHPKRHGRRSSWYAVAAMIALLIGAGAAATAVLKSRWSGETIRTFVAEPGQRGEVRLADGSKVLLGPGSSIDVRVPFGDVERLVKVRGEAYFDVVSQPDQPFFVDAGRSRTEVVGTKFAVRAFASENAVRVIVAEGVVRFSMLHTSTEPTLTVDAGKMGVLDDGAGRLHIEPADLDEALGWVDGRLVFRSVPLRTVVKDLSRWYGIVFRTSSPELDGLHFTGDFQNESVREIVDVLQYTLDLTYRMSGDTITFHPRRNENR